MIEFDQTPNVHFFLCRQCRAHIALIQEYVFTDIMVEACILRNAVNVQVDGEEEHYRMEGDQTVADASCERCRTLLGWKIVKVEMSNIVVQPGRFLLYLDKLLLWDGSQMLHADTHEPVENG